MLLSSHLSIGFIYPTRPTEILSGRNAESVDEVKAASGQTLDERENILKGLRRQDMKKKFIIASLFFLGAVLPRSMAAPEASQLLEQMDYVLRGHSHQMKVTMDVKTKQWERHYEIQVWMKGLDYAFARVMAPPKVKGQGFLRIKSRFWQYLPTAERTILIPPSLMLDDFLGSDFSNDDFVKLSYLARDYEAKIISEENLDGFEVYHLELIPHPDAPVTYGKLEVWLRKEDAAPVRWAFYN